MGLEPNTTYIDNSVGYYDDKEIIDRLASLLKYYDPPQATKYRRLGTEHAGDTQVLHDIIWEAVDAIDNHVRAEDETQCFGIYPSAFEGYGTMPIDMDDMDEDTE